MYDQWCQACLWSSASLIHHKFSGQIQSKQLSNCCVLPGGFGEFELSKEELKILKSFTPEFQVLKDAMSRQQILSWIHGAAIQQRQKQSL